VTDRSPGALEEIVGVVEPDGVVEAQVDPVGVDSDMDESITGAAGEGVAGGDGVVGVVDELGGGGGLAEDEGAGGEGEVTDSGGVWAEEVEVFGVRRGNR
jgi:hypothetical protein